MRTIRRLSLWYGLLSKRLLRRGAYLAVLALVPLFCAAILLFSRQSSGMVTVALHCADLADPASRAAAERLTTGDSLVRVLPCDSEADARVAVERGEADAAWLLHADMTEQLRRFAAGGGGTAVTVVEREDNVFLMLAREKLFAAMYPSLSRSLFSHFLDNADGAADYYDGAFSTRQILQFTTAHGEVLAAPEHYLVAPLRGILSVVLMLGSFASAMYGYRDEELYSFVWLSGRKRALAPILCHLTAATPVAAAVYAALALGGMLAEPLWELLLLVLLVLSAAFFCELIRCLAGRACVLGALIPLMTVAMLVLCPVFADLELLEPVARLFPPYHYLRAVFSRVGAAILAGYTAALATVTLFVSRLRQRRL